MIVLSRSNKSLSVSAIGSTSLQPMRLSAPARASPPFSIRNRIDFASTRASSQRAGTILGLSVSAIGSTSLQRRASAQTQKKPDLSVSAIGSTSLQRPSPTGSRWSSIAFSIRNRIDFASTRTAALLQMTLPDFQYPQSDRLRFN